MAFNMASKKEVEKDGLAAGMFGDIDILQKRHSLMIADLNAHLARYSEINKEQKATLNRELEFPEHALLSITQAARAYKDSSEAFELVLSHLVEFYRDYVDNMEIATDINKVSEQYGMKIIKLENEIHKAATLRGIHIQRIEILTSQVQQYETELDAMQKKLIEKKYNAIPNSSHKLESGPQDMTNLSHGTEPPQPAASDSLTRTEPHRVSNEKEPTQELQNSEVSNSPNNTGVQDAERHIGSDYTKKLSPETPNDNTITEVSTTNAKTTERKDNANQGSSNAQPRSDKSDRPLDPSRLCIRCGHSWRPYKQSAKMCPRCGMPWNIPPPQDKSTRNNLPKRAEHEEPK